MIKIQNIKRSRFGHWYLRFGYCLLFGACDLGFKKVHYSGLIITNSLLQDPFL